uniref:MARVEL domain-containing protein n=1 Tax=Oncorhynchus tshawytscha TaxID=74940 RepID=A0AAZ3RJV5_ONCTS
MSRYLERDEYDEMHNSRERDCTHDRGSKERERQKRDKMDERYRDEKGSGDDRRDREKDYSDRQRDMTPCSHKDPPPDHRGGSQGQQRTPMLLGEALVNLLIGLGYIPALVFYFIKLQETYDKPICTEKEVLYKSKGHQGFACALNGADSTGGLFGVLGVNDFIFGMVLAICAFRAVCEMKRQRAMEDGNL